MIPYVIIELRHLLVLNGVQVDVAGQLWMSQMNFVSESQAMRMRACEGIGKSIWKGSPLDISLLQINSFDRDLKERIRNRFYRCSHDIKKIIVRQD